MMRYKLISCEVLYREICATLARSPHQIDVEFCSKGLHDLGGAAMRERLQEIIDRVDPTKYDWILLGYALCGNGIQGLVARTLPLVVPRAHDCIALLMGSRQSYQKYFENNTGVYFRSTGWLERGGNLEQVSNRIMSNKGVNYSLQNLIEKYGEENGRYLYEQFTDYQKHYRQLTFIEMGIEPDDRFEKQAQEEAGRRGWTFEKIRGDLCLFERLVSGDWSEADFLVVPKGHRIKPTYGEDIIGLEEVTG
ncbi:MAG: DUF1638 domain-containing protein [Terriglobia bacterium]